MFTLIAIIAAYFIGSISSAIVASYVMKLPDPRTVGSKNAGATNMIRNAGKKVAIWVLVGDILKGMIALMIGKMLSVPDVSLGFVALAVVIGHILPVYFQFKGGKGVATMLGALFCLSLTLGTLVVITWGVVVLISKYASLASIVATVATLVYTLLLGMWAYFFPFLLIAIIILYKHKDNIQRLKAGIEHTMKL